VILFVMTLLFQGKGISGFIDYFDTPASQGKPIGWQAQEDWEAALKSMQAAGVVAAGWNAKDYYTNALVE